MYSRTSDISVIDAAVLMLYRAEVRISCATFAALSKALLGTQPVQVQSPPIRFFSTSATLAPSCAANRAPTKPPEPAPITTTSYRSFIHSAPQRIRNRSRGFGFGSEKIVSFRLKYLKWG